MNPARDLIETQTRFGLAPDQQESRGEMPPFTPPGLRAAHSGPAQKSAKANSSSSPSTAAKGITATLYVDGTESIARLQHTYIAGESLSLITKSVRECQDARAGVLHEKTMWDSASRTRVENPRFQAKFAGLCNKDEDGDVVTDVGEFVSYVHTHVLVPLEEHFESVTYFLKREAGKVPSRYISYEDFKKELDEFDFTLAEPSVLARLAYIEQFLLKQQQAGVFKEI